MGEDWLKLLKTFYAWKEIILVLCTIFNNHETFQKILIMLWMGSFKTLFFFSVMIELVQHVYSVTELIYELFIAKYINLLEKILIENTRKEI